MTRSCSRHAVCTHRPPCSVKTHGSKVKRSPVPHVALLAVAMSIAARSAARRSGATDADLAEGLHFLAMILDDFWRVRCRSMCSFYKKGRKFRWQCLSMQMSPQCRMVAHPMTPWGAACCKRGRAPIDTSAQRALRIRNPRSRCPAPITIAQFAVRIAILHARPRVVLPNGIPPRAAQPHTHTHSSSCRTRTGDSTRTPPVTFRAPRTPSTPSTTTTTIRLGDPSGLRVSPSPSPASHPLARRVGEPSTPPSVSRHGLFT